MSTVAYDVERELMLAEDRRRRHGRRRHLPTTGQIIRTAGSWTAALELAGLPIPGPEHGKNRGLTLGEALELIFMLPYQNEINEINETRATCGKLRSVQNEKLMALALEHKTELPTLPRLLTTKEVAEMLRVTTRTVQNWVEAERIPFVKLPSGQFRIPLQGLLTSLGGSHDLNAELASEAGSLAAEMRGIDAATG